MKMKQNMILLAAAALALAACNNETPETDNRPVAARITAGLSAPTTRAIGTNWNADEIGVWVKDAPASDMETLYKNVHYTTDSKEATATFTATTGEGIFFQDATETVTFAAYAPYQPSEDNETLPGDNGKVDVDTETNNTETLQEDIDFLFAEGATATRTNYTVTFADNTASGGADHSFHHKMAQLNVVFQTSSMDGFNESDIFGGSFNLGGLVHDGTFNVTDGTTALTGEPLGHQRLQIHGCRNHTHLFPHPVAARPHEQGSECESRHRRTDLFQQRCHQPEPSSRLYIHLHHHGEKERACSQRMHHHSMDRRHYRKR